MTLIGRDNELAILDEAWRNANLVQIIAPGGAASGQARASHDAELPAFLEGRLESDIPQALGYFDRPADP